ncbi:hypothetical protein CRD_00183 [Raphidiopsis brookii D9]|nr:hypothetical protein CRD_00183 [Raphidiopsis brookii D9]
MTNQEILSEISSLPDEAKKQVVSLISSLKKSYRKTGLDSNLSGKQVSNIWYDYGESSGNYISSINSSSQELTGKLDTSKTLIVEVVQEEDGGFIAKGLTEEIFTQGDTWEELRKNIIEAVKAYYFDQSPLPAFKLHLIRDELIIIG